MLIQSVCFQEEPKARWVVLSQHVKGAGDVGQHWQQLVLWVHCCALAGLAQPQFCPCPWPTPNTSQQRGPDWELMKAAKTSLESVQFVGDYMMQRNLV